MCFTRHSDHRDRDNINHHVINYSKLIVIYVIYISYIAALLVQFKLIAYSTRIFYTPLQPL